MRHDPYAKCLQKEIERTSCEVCGDYKAAFDSYCDECKQYKKMAENKRKAEARAKAFGRIFL